MVTTNAREETRGLLLLQRPCPSSKMPSDRWCDCMSVTPRAALWPDLMQKPLIASYTRSAMVTGRMSDAKQHRDPGGRSELLIIWIAYIYAATLGRWYVYFDIEIPSLLSPLHMPASFRKKSRVLETFKCPGIIFGLWVHHLSYTHQTPYCKSSSF